MFIALSPGACHLKRYTNVVNDPSMSFEGSRQLTGPAPRLTKRYWRQVSADLDFSRNYRLPLFLPTNYKARILVVILLTSALTRRQISASLTSFSVSLVKSTQTGGVFAIETLFFTDTSFEVYWEARRLCGGEVQLGDTRAPKMVGRNYEPGTSLDYYRGSYTLRHVFCWPFTTVAVPNETLRRRQAGSLWPRAAAPAWTTVVST